MDDAIAGAQGHAAAVRDELGQGAMSDHIHWLWIGCRVAEGLHDKVRLKTKASQVLELVAGHGSGGVLGAHGAHARLAVGARHHTVHTAGLSDHLLRQRKALDVHLRLRHLFEGRRGAQGHRFAGAVRQAAADDQRDAAAGADLIQHQFMLQAELHQDITGAVLLHHLFVDAKVNKIPHGQVLHVHLKWQSAGILHGIEKDRSNGASNHKAPCALVWGARNILTHVPQNGIGC
mmetsp:Transcript_9446/g.16189  ORF Transcript_9446/g.16189 Transcript_9446/m.16189 type:complete len:233 (-) Transcript_9446:882-1580(-)